MKNENLKAITEVIKPKPLSTQMPPSIVQETDVNAYLESINRYEQELLATSMKYIDDSIALFDQISNQEGAKHLTRQEDSYTPNEVSPQLTTGQLK